MPPRQNPPPTGTPRRKPGPVMPNSWIWLVLLATALVAMVLFQGSGGSTIDWSEFLSMVKKQEVAKIVFQGTDQITGEIKEKAYEADQKLPEKERRLRSRKFTTSIPPGAEKEIWDSKILEKDPELKISKQEAPFSWVGPAFFVVLPMLL